MSDRTRRQFLCKTIPGVALGGVGLTVLQPAATEAQQPAAVAGSAGRYAIELDGQLAGFIDSAQGGAAMGVVVRENPGADNIPHKHLAGVTYEDIVLSCGTGMSKNFYEWIKAAFGSKLDSAGKNGAIIAYDSNFKPIYRLEWKGGFITEIGLPACDASSKDVARMNFKITPESTHLVFRPPGTVKPPPPEAARKPWSSANFRLQITDCPAASRAVRRIEAITLKTSPSPLGVGVTREAMAPLHKLEVPNLAMTTVQPDEFYQWFEELVVKAQGKEKSGTLEFLTPENKEALFTLQLRGLGIFKLTPDKGDIRGATAEMYCEDIGFSYSSGA